MRMMSDMKTCKSVILFKDDLANGSLGLSWNGLLETLGVDTHTMVDGKLIDRQIDSVDIIVQETVAFDQAGQRMSVVV